MGVLPAFRGRIGGTGLVRSEVIARAEGGACPGDYGDTDVIVGIDLVEDIFKLVHERMTEGVAPLWTIEGDCRDTIAIDFIDNHLVISHGTVTPYIGYQI